MTRPRFIFTAWYLHQAYLVRLLFLLVCGATATNAFGAGGGEEIPFRCKEGLIWVQVGVPESAAPLNFLLDTGAGVSVINLRTAQKLGIKLGRKVSVRGVGSTTAGYWPQHLETTTTGWLPNDWLAVDLGVLSGACECQVDGLIGADFFKDRIVKIDFAARKIRRLSAMEGLGDTFSVPLRVRRGALLAPIRVDESALKWVRLDTGCASPLRWVGSGSNRANRRAEQAVALTRLSIVVSPTRVQFGPDTFQAVPTGFHENEIFPGEAGLLGNGILSRYRSVTVDWKSRRLFLQQAKDMDTATTSPEPARDARTR